MTISNDLKCKYLRILDKVKSERAKLFTQSEMAEFMKVSTRKIVYFERGQVDFELLFCYCDILGIEYHLFVKV